MLTRLPSKLCPAQLGLKPAVASYRTVADFDTNWQNSSVRIATEVAFEQQKSQTIDRLANNFSRLQLVNGQQAGFNPPAQGLICFIAATQLMLFKITKG